jgi:hypothetical protein
MRPPQRGLVQVGIWEVAEVDAEERLTADKSQGRFRHIIDL